MQASDAQVRPHKVRILGLQEIICGSEPLVGREQDLGAQAHVGQVSSLSEGLLEQAVIVPRVAPAKCVRVRSGGEGPSAEAPEGDGRGRAEERQGTATRRRREMADERHIFKILTNPCCIPTKRRREKVTPLHFVSRNAGRAQRLHAVSVAGSSAWVRSSGLAVYHTTPALVV